MGLAACFVAFFSVGVITGLFIAADSYCRTIRGWKEQNGRLMDMLAEAGDVIIRQNADLILISKRAENFNDMFIN